MNVAFGVFATPRAGQEGAETGARVAFSLAPSSWEGVNLTDPESTNGRLIEAAG